MKRCSTPLIIFKCKSKPCWIPPVRMADTHTQSYLGSRLQNSSNPVLANFDQKKYVSALSACSGLVTLARTCMSHNATRKRKCFIIGRLPSTHRFRHLSQVLEQINNQYLGTTIFEVTSVGEDVEKREPLCTVGGNVNCYSQYGKQYGVSSKIKIELCYYLAISLLDICPKKIKTRYQKDMYITMFTAALFMIETM